MPLSCRHFAATPLMMPDTLRHGLMMHAAAPPLLPALLMMPPLCRRYYC